MKEDLLWQVVNDKTGEILKQGFSSYQEAKQWWLKNTKLPTCEIQGYSQIQAINFKERPEFWD